MVALPHALPTSRKSRGAFFTPPAIANFISVWAIRNAQDRILEPSCGDAVFLISAAERLRSLGGQPTASQLNGVDVHEDSIATAVRKLEHRAIPGDLRILDFFELTASSGPKYDVVIGNPPYVRYQTFAGPARARSQAVAKIQGVDLGGLASSWAAFVVHASSFLTDGGRMGLVVPAELLVVNYAAPIRRFLMERFKRVQVIIFEARVFPGVSEEVVLLLAEGRGPAPHVDIAYVTDVSELPPRTLRSWTPQRPGDRWVGALVDDDVLEAYDSLRRDGARFSRLGDWGTTNLGMVTGNNEFFAISQSRASELALRKDELLPISPPSSKHLRSLDFTRADWAAMRDAGDRVYLFHPNETTKSAGARLYIEEGWRQGVHTAYKCRVRSPWWRVPYAATPDFFLTYMNHAAPQLVANSARVSHVNSVHGVQLRQRFRRLGGHEVMPLAFLNSVTLLGAELEGRAYGGGVLKVEPREASALPVPVPEVVVTDAFQMLKDIEERARIHLASGRLDDAVDLVDRELLVKTLKVPRGVVLRVKEARATMGSRRLNRSRARL